MIDAPSTSPEQNTPASPPKSASAIPTLSVFIICHNEVDRIGATIDAIRAYANEIIVVDSGSTDGTPELAAQLGARVLHNAWAGYGPQKRFAEEACAGPWLLNLDADEFVPRALADEISTLFGNGEPPYAAYRLHIAEQFPGEREPHRFAYTLSPVRLYRKDAGRYSPSPVHDRVVLNPGVREGTLKQRIHHRSVRSLSHQIAKLNAYTDQQVADMVARNRRLSPYRILFEFPLAFLKVYLLRRHFVHGFYGIATAMNLAIARHLRVAKAIEAERVRRVNEQQVPKG